MALKLKHSALALGFAVLIEFILAAAFIKFGRFSLERSEGHNLIGNLIGNFHMPGYLLAKSLGIPKELGMLFILFTGIVQLFFLALCARWLLRKLRSNLVCLILAVVGAWI